MHKTSSKINVIEENYHSNKLLYYLLLVFTKFLNRILSGISKSHIPKMWVNFLFIWKGQTFLCQECISSRILTWIWKAVIWAVYFSKSTHTTQFRTGTRNWYLASYKEMRHLESNCIWNFLFHMKFLKRVR